MLFVWFHWLTILPDHSWVNWKNFFGCLEQTNNIYHSKLLKISLFSGPTFGDSGRSEFMLKKHSTLQKARLSIELTQYWEWAEYNTLNFAQFFPNDDQFILRFYFFTLTQTCADPDAILKNFTFLEFEFFVLKILTDFLTLTDL